VSEHTFLSRSPEETERLGEGLAKRLQAGDVVALSGELGTGKTTLVRGIARGLGVKEDEVASPSFTIINEYPSSPPLYHIDFYRLERLEELTEIGYWEYLEGEGIVVIEWADRIPEAIPPASIWLTLRFRQGEEREIKVKGEGEIFRRIVEELMRRG